MGSWAKKEKRTEFVKRKVETLLLNWKRGLTKNVSRFF